jgi:hypothetical protein
MTIVHRNIPTLTDWDLGDEERLRYNRPLEQVSKYPGELI